MATNRSVSASEVSRLVPLESGESISGAWDGGSSTTIILTTHRFLVFHKTGFLKPRLESIFPERCFRLEAVAPVGYSMQPKNQYVEIQGQKLLVLWGLSRDVAEATNAQRSRRIAELSASHPPSSSA